MIMNRLYPMNGMKCYSLGDNEMILIFLKLEMISIEIGQKIICGKVGIEINLSKDKVICSNFYWQFDQRLIKSYVLSIFIIIHFIFIIVCQFELASQFKQYQELMMKRRREQQCRFYSGSDLLYAFESANNKISNKFKESSQNMLNQGVIALRNLTYDYLGISVNENEGNLFTFQAPQQESNKIQSDLYSKKPMIEKKQEFKPIREMTFNKFEEIEFAQSPPSFFQKTGVKQERQSSVKKSSQSSAQKLKKSFKKLGLDERFYLQNQDDYDEKEQENHEKFNLNHEGKTLAQLLYESNRKIEEQILKKPEQAESSDESYPMTDYSSNSSSNENVYEEDYRTESSMQSMQIQRSQSQNASSQENYRPMRILNSPKKSKSKVKRLYIRNKKIPRWAENLSNVPERFQNEDASSQQGDARFGYCIAQKLNTNLIFKTEGRLNRGSSAKWNRYPTTHNFIT